MFSPQGADFHLFIWKPRVLCFRTKHKRRLFQWTAPIFCQDLELMGINLWCKWHYRWIILQNFLLTNTIPFLHLDLSYHNKCQYYFQFWSCAHLETCCCLNSSRTCNLTDSCATKKGYDLKNKTEATTIYLASCRQKSSETVSIHRNQTSSINNQLRSTARLVYYRKWTETGQKQVCTKR